MNTKMRLLALLIGVISQTGHCMTPPDIDLPTRTGRLTKLSESKFIDLSKVVLIEGNICVSARGQDRVFPLSKMGQKAAMDYLKEELKKPPMNPHQGGVYVPATVTRIYTAVRLDEKIHIIFDSKEDSTDVDPASVEKRVSDSVPYLDAILKLAQ